MEIEEIHQNHRSLFLARRLGQLPPRQYNNNNSKNRQAVSMRWQLSCYRGSLMMMGVIDPRLTSCCQGQAPGIRQTRQQTRTLGGGQRAHRPRPPAEVPRGRGHRQAGAGSGYKEAAPLGQVSVQQVVQLVSPRCPPRCRWPRWFYVSMRGSLRFPQPSCSREDQESGKVFSCRLSPQELLAVHTR